MTEQLHDLLARIADQAGPGSSDPTLWGRARRARRRDRAVRASAAALTILVLVGAIAVGLGTRSASPPAKQTPAPHETGVGIPSTVRGIHGDGGLDLETDLAVGPASVAIANQSGAFVITAADGLVHRLRLAGFDPSASNANQTGIALSPDGTRLAYGWREPKASGSGSLPRIGTRILDLRTGASQEFPAVPPYVVDRKPLSTRGYGWSPNGRYLVFEILAKDPGGQAPEDHEGGHAYVGLDTARARFSFFSSDARAAACSQGTACKPMTLVNPRGVARAGNRDGAEGPFLVFGGYVKDGVGFNPTPLPGDADWTVGRFSPEGRRILLQPDGVGTGLVLVSDPNPHPHDVWEGKKEATLLHLDPADWPNGAKVDVLGWVGADHALALVNRGTGPDTWEPGGKLVLVDVNSVPGTAVGDTPVDLDVVGKVEPGDPASTYSFATDFATVDAPTRDFDDASSPKKSDPNPDGALPSQHRSDGDATRLVAFTVAGLIVLAAISLALARSRKKSNIYL